MHGGALGLRIKVTRKQHEIATLKDQMAVMQTIIAATTSSAADAAAEAAKKLEVAELEKKLLQDQCNILS